MRIRDPGWRQFGSGMEKSRSGIRDNHPGSATLHISKIKSPKEVTKQWDTGNQGFSDYFYLMIEGSDVLKVTDE
jgi:hypothetical protein